MNIAMHFGEEYEDDFDIGGHDDHSVQEKYKLVEHGFFLYFKLLCN